MSSRPVDKEQNRILLHTLLAGVGLGGGLTAAHRLLKGFDSSFSQRKKLEQKPIPIYIPAPTQEEEKTKAAPPSLDKFGIFDNIDKGVSNLSGLMDGGSTGDRVWDFKFIPKAVLAAAGGLLAGHMGVSAIAGLAKDRRMQQKAEDAKKEYEELLQQRYELSKMGAVTLEDNINKKYEEWAGSRNTKEATSWLGDRMHEIGGAGLTLGAALWILSHMYTKDKIVKSDKEELDKKLTQYGLEMNRTQSAPRFEAVQLPAPAPKPQPKPEAPKPVEEPEKEEVEADKFGSFDSALGRVAAMPQPIQDKAKQRLVTVGQEVAGKPETGDVITSGIDPGAVQDGVQEAVTEEMFSKSSNLFLTLFQEG